MNIDDEIQKLLNRAIPANDNRDEPMARAATHDDLHNTGVNVVGNHNIVIEFNSVFFSFCVICLFILNLIANR